MSNTTIADKKIILGVSGSIAAYKAATLTRLLIKSGAEVRVLMTQAATDFITPLTLSTLSKNAVYLDVSNGESWNNHVELGLWADAMVVAPMTSTTLAKFATGICDNILSAVYLSAKCPVFFAPAMDLDMWKHPATRKNVTALQSYGNHLIPVGYGELASGLVGNGRMAEPEQIVEQLHSFFQTSQDLHGKKALVTAGPTYEPIDPVRFIGNRSSGKMGIAVAEALAARGAMVELILGPTKLTVDNAFIHVYRVQTAQEMYEAATKYFDDCDIAVLAAAVADYSPRTVATEKIKKSDAEFSIALERTLDIAATLGGKKRTDQIVVGFALETHNANANAQRKLLKKNFDFIVLNSLKDKGAGFEYDTNKVSMIHRDGNTVNYPLKSKKAVAEDIVDAILNY